MARKFLLLIAAVHALMPLQAVLPLVLFTAIGADVRSLHHRCERIPAGVHLRDGIALSDRVVLRFERRIGFVSERKGVVVFLLADTARFPL